MIRFFVTLLLFAVSLIASAEPIIPIKPFTVENESHQAKINLGRKLFYENKLSVDQSFSCHSCHVISQGGDDNVQKSMGGRFSKRNSPTIFNVSKNFRQLWDGRKDDLHSQIDGLGSKLFNFENGVKLIKTDSEYKALFLDAYEGNINSENIKDAIVKYEEYLVTPNSPFDKFLAGDTTAISEKAKRGYIAFKKHACTGCHNGANVGGSMFQVFGIHADASLENISNTDFGRYNITKKEFHKYMFKVPSLRWAVHTAPYLHDGSVKTLKEMVQLMSRLQAGSIVPEKDQNDIIEFLKTLPGELPENEIQYSELHGKEK